MVTHSSTSLKLGWLLEHLVPLDACPLCSSKNPKPLFQLDALRIHRCPNCSMMFLNPYLSPEQMTAIFSSKELLQKVSSFFADYYEEESWSTPKTLSIYANVLSKLNRRAGRGGKLLDVGCGKGAFLKIAKRDGWQCFGIEPNCPEAGDLEKNFGIHIVQEDFLKTNLPEREFDVITLWDLIEHVPNPAEWIQKASKLLKPDGFFVIATPNHASFLDVLALWAYRLSFGRFSYALEKLYTVDHTLYFTDQTLRNLLEDQGFKWIENLKTNSDLSRYSMSAWFRVIAESLLAISSSLQLENRIIMFTQKGS